MQNQFISEKAESDRLTESLRKRIQQLENEKKKIEKEMNVKVLGLKNENHNLQNLLDFCQDKDEKWP